MIPKLEVRQIDPKTHGLYVDGELIGTTKGDCDARFHMYFLERKFKDVWDAGYKAAIAMVAEGKNE